MNIFETVKASVSPSWAAERYGLTVSRNGMTNCCTYSDREAAGLSQKTNHSRLSISRLINVSISHLPSGVSAFKHFK